MAVSYEDSLPASRMLSSSVSSLSSSRQQSSQIAKAYRQAAQLFLTRRLPEALSTIEPVISPPESDHSNGSQNGDYPAFAPVASASRGTRIKVWSFYLTFLNSVVELGAEEGKHAFGSTRWKALVAKCRDGSIWEDVVRVGYGGNEGDVDADVVINLATLLLTHAPSQKLTQQRLETYLSASAHPTFDISSHMESSIYQTQRRPSQHNNGTSTPRDLNTRLKLLELYTLHVLPKNEEWDYAREFISMSEVLDDERKEAFLLALHNLREEKEETESREAQLRQQQQEQLEQRRKEAESRRIEQSRAEDERRKRDEENRQQPRSADELYGKPPPSNRTQPSPTPSRASRPAKKAVIPPPNFYNRASSLFAAMQTLILNTAHSMTNNPMALLRTLLFILAFALAFGRQDLRERVQRILRNALEKVRRTVGMGVKVSYI
ncbi:hypothetical protein K432DRAFT_429964 [Lepidopterella palustris CBS 459.81]|uniref:Peroxin 26 n=1 Tax=Lepidopterella palustris CBS 459.81 TaxID=1314670 RepID=A0A8E2J9S1_9PEZI|nr:hypothetical protein K432DRAFT_429964 [Lepidopterella palustris CBS 459.81]